MSERRTTPLGQEELDKIADRGERRDLETYDEEVLSLKERLLRGVTRKVKRFFYQIGDDEIPIDIRIMTSSERQRAFINYQKISKMQESEEEGLVEYNEAMEVLCELLDSIVTTEELKGCFSKGEDWVTDGLVMRLTLESLKFTSEETGASLESFRGDAGRPNPA